LRNLVRDEPHVSLSQLGALIWSGRWRLLLCVLASLAGAMVLSLWLPKTYEAKARVILELMRPDPVLGTSYNTKNTEAYIQTQQLLVTSGRVGERVIEKLGWVDNPAVIDSWQQATGGTGDIKTWAAGRLLGAIGAYPLEGGGTLEIVYRSPNQEAAETIVRAIRESYIETALALQTEAAARRATRFAELVVPARKAFDAERANLLAVQRETGTVLGYGGKDIRNGTLSRLVTEGRTAQLSAQRTVNQAMRRVTSQQIGMLRQDLIQVEQRLAMADNTLGGSNPDYDALTEQRALLVGQIAKATAVLRAQGAVAANAAQRLNELNDTAYQAERERLLDSAPVDLRIAQAQRMVALREGELQRLEANLANARQASERTESGLVVMGDVIASKEPVAPNFPLNALLASLFGLGLGLASVMIDGLWRREVRVPQDLAGAAGVPVLAVLRSRRARSWWPLRRGRTAAA